jgi:hypothetical protein
MLNRPGTCRKNEQLKALIALILHLVIAQLYSGHRSIYYEDLAAAAGEDERETKMIAPARVIPVVKGDQAVDIPAHIIVDKEIGKVGTVKEKKGNRTTLHECRYKNQTFHTPQFPTFIIAGAQKTGTTSLFHYFSQHPKLVGPEVREEGHFFDQILPYLSKTTSNDKEWWCYVRQKYFEIWPTEGRLLLDNPTTLFSYEKTPSYIHQLDTPSQLKATCPWIPKVVMILRNPVDRAYSHYKMLVEKYPKKNRKTPFAHFIWDEVLAMRYRWNMTTARGPSQNGRDIKVSVPWDHPIDERQWVGDPLNRNDVHQMVRKGLYAPQIRQWLRDYPRDSILVIDYRDLERNTSEVYFRILDFAGVPHDAPSHSFEERKRSTKHAYPPMANATKAYLESFFAPYNAQLEELLGEEWKGAWASGW